MDLGSGHPLDNDQSNVEYSPSYEKRIYHMTRTAVRALSLQNYGEIPERAPYAMARAGPEKALRPC